MSITQKIKKYHKNRIESIKKMKKGIDRDMSIGALVADLGKGSIKPVAKAIKSCFRKVKNCFILFTEKKCQLTLEFRGRKKVEDKDLKLIDRIKEIVYKYENTDSHFKTEKL